MAVQGFASKALERFFSDGAIPKRAGWSAVARVVARKLDILDYAERLGDLASPPGNRLEALKGNMIGYHSIRINDQWRVVFRWTDAGPIDVDVVDYHQG
jgi:proteic killer suppression protein